MFANAAPSRFRSLSLLLGLVLWLPLAALAQEVDRGMLVHFPFEDSLEEGMGSTVPTTVRGSIEYADGALGRALLLTDGDELDFNAVPTDAFSDDFTVAWFMHLDGQGPTRLFGRESTCDSTHRIVTAVSAGNPAQLDFVMSGATGAAAASALVPRGSWTHVALVRTGEQFLVYVDGRPGQPQDLPRVTPGVIPAPFGLANSPCIDAGGNAPQHPEGRFDDLRVYPVALDAALIAQLARRPSLVATPSIATPGGRLRANASHLVEDRPYLLQLSNGQDSAELFNGAATASTMQWSFEVPALPPGEYAVQLISLLQNGVKTLDGQDSLRIGAPLSVAAADALQAGKPALVNVGNLPGTGTLRLLLAGRVLAGPVVADGTSHEFRLTMPHDLSSPTHGLELRAEVLSGRLVTHVGRTTVPVAAPFTGPFADVTRLEVDDTSPQLDQPFTLSGTLALADGATMAGLGLSAYWMAGDGSVTPLPTMALQTSANGAFTLTTRPPSLAAMTAVPARDSGTVRLALSRTDASGRTDWQVQDGPFLHTSMDIDPDTDITVHVKRRVVGGTEPLQGAYVVLSSAAPLGYNFDLPNTGGSAGEPVGGGSVYQQHQPRLSMSDISRKGFGMGSNAAVNQVNNGFNSIPPPPPPSCGEDLYRRYTDASGKAEFPVLGAPEEEVESWQMMNALQFGAAECSGAACLTAELLSYNEFELTVYTLHKGAGYRNELNHKEIPVRFRIRYRRDTETFEIRNLNTGEESTQVVSANLQVEVPQIAASNFVNIGSPFMYQEVGGVPVNLVAKHEGGFGQWIDFENTGVSEFVTNPTRVIQFGHRPDVNGSITSAQLWLRANNGQDNVIGDFEQVSFVDGCNVQDDPSGNRPETWRFTIPADYDNSWRFPEGVFFPVGGERRACGYIRVENARGGVGRHNLCFYWQAPPSFMLSGSGIVVDDSDMLDVLIEESGRSMGAAATTVPKRNADFLGEPIDKPGRIDNQTNTRRGAYASVGPWGAVGGSRNLKGNNPRQFSEDAAGEKTFLGIGHAPVVIDIGDDEYQTILDTTIPLFQWYWGVPEILSAEVYARLKLMASYYFGGTLTVDDDGERLDMLTNAVFMAAIVIGVDIDVLFGFIVDAGASLTGLVLSEMPVEVINNQSQGLQPCFGFQLRFDYYIDPCPLCPTPVIEGGDSILDERVPDNCTFYSASRAAGLPGTHPEVAALAGAGAKSLQYGYAQARDLRRHANVAFDTQGNGQFAMLDDNRNLVASAMDGASLSPAALLSAAPGVRDPQIAYYASDRAVAVWSESALEPGEFINVNDYPLLARNQRLAWAQWDGEGWSTKKILTEPGKGEGQIALTACMDGAADCPAGGEVLAIWQRDANADATDPNNRLWHARFRPATGFSSPDPLDPSVPGNVQDITPAAAYVGGRPVVVWTRQFGPSLSNFSQRNLAYRVLPDGTARVLPGAPGATAPAASSAGGNRLRVSWLRPDLPGSGNPDAANAGAVGTHNALHVAGANCDATQCSFPTVLIPPARDEHGRRIYGERPRMVRTGNDVLLVMRMFSFGGDGPVQDGDPIGTVINSADMVQVAPNYQTGISRVTPLSADGATHAGVFAAYNPFTQTMVAGSSTFLPPFAAPFRAALKATGYKGHRAYAKTMATAGPVELVSAVAAPDLGVDAIEHTSTLEPGANQATAVIVGNRGTSYLARFEHTATLQLRWNSPGGPVLASAEVPSLEAGGETVVDLEWRAPTDAHPDEAHSLHAVLVMPDVLLEITDDNNARVLELPGLPVPGGLAFNAPPGLPQVQIGWDPVDDPRVAGYRVYRREDDGSWLPLGASPAHGFLDLSASFFVPRTYAVASYSERGIESPLSAHIVAMPVTITAERVFRDGFEPQDE